MNADPVTTDAGLDSLAMLGKTASVLLLIIGLIFLCAWLYRRLNSQRYGHQRLLRVVDSVAVGTRERVVVVSLKQQWLVLGVASGQVTLLDRLEAPDETSPAPGTAATPTLSGNFAQRLGQAMRHQVSGRPPGPGRES